MYYEEFSKYYRALQNAPCPKTEALIKAGYQQQSGGYISLARKMGVAVDKSVASPGQGWHFIQSYLNRVNPATAKIERIVCGELLFWMAEVSNALTADELDELAKSVQGVSSRREANKIIRTACWPRILEKVVP